MMATAATPEEDPDIVVAMIREVLAMDLGMTAEQAAAIEQRLKARYGDQRIRVKKKLQFSDARSPGVGLSDALRDKVFQDGLTDLSTPEIAQRNGVSTRTVYYWMKKGNRQSSR